MMTEDEEKIPEQEVEEQIYASEAPYYEKFEDVVEPEGYEEDIPENELLEETEDLEHSLDQSQAVVMQEPPAKPKYSSFEEITQDLVRLNLERQIAREELIGVKYELLQDLKPLARIPKILGAITTVGGLAYFSKRLWWDKD